VVTQCAHSLTLHTREVIDWWLQLLAQPSNGGCSSRQVLMLKLLGLKCNRTQAGLTHHQLIIS